MNSKEEKPRIRRSSTARSIGARSDFDTSVNGEEYEIRSVVTEDHERQAQREEANAHLHQYISGQLQRVIDDDAAGDVDREEYEAHA